MRRLLAVAICLITGPSLGLAHDGDLDLSFGVGGKDFQLYFGGAYISDQSFVSVAPQSSGKLIVAATLQGANADFGAMRLLDDGGIDPTFGNFGNSGAEIIPFDRSGSTMNDLVASVVVQPDDKIVLAGYVDGDATTGTDFGIVRLTADGLPDNAFGANGMVTVPFNLGSPNVSGALDDVATAVNLQADGKILVAGAALTSTNAVATDVMAVARLNAGNGQRDCSFNVDGRATVSFGGDLAKAFQVRQLADQSHIVVVGGSATKIANNGYNNDFALAKFDANGNLDPTFGNGGKTTFAFDIGGGLSDVAEDFVELPDGALFVCGIVSVNAPTNSDFGCMRFLADGTPDPAFTPLLIPFDRGGDMSDFAFHMTRDMLGRLIIVGGSSGPSNIDFAIARCFDDGTLDASFGFGGTLPFSSVPMIANPPPDRANIATGVLVQPDGKIVVAGIADSDGSGDYEIQLVRLIGDTIFGNGFD